MDFQGLQSVISHRGPYSFLEWDPKFSRQLEGMNPSWKVIEFSLAKNQTLEFEQQFEADSWLVALTASFSAAPGLNVQIYDSVNERSFTQRPVNISNLFGTGQYQSVLPRPQHFKKMTTLMIRLQNLSAAPNSGQIVFYGVTP